MEDVQRPTDPVDSGAQFEEALADKVSIEALLHARPYEPNQETFDPDCQSTVRGYLRQLTQDNWFGHHRSRTWGYTVLRTSYEDDARFQAALNVIKRYLRLRNDDEARHITSSIEYKVKWSGWPERVPACTDTALFDEFLKRYVNDVLQDRDALEGASVTECYAYFKRWAIDHWHLDPKYISAASPRLKSAILMDAETIDQLQNFPEDIGDQMPFAVASKFWVKMIEAEPRPRGGSRTTEWGMVDCYRVRVADLISFWFGRTWNEPANKTWQTDLQDPQIHYHSDDFLPPGTELPVRDFLINPPLKSFTP